MDALCSEAKAVWARGPSPLTPTRILRFRFHLTDVVRDLEAMPERSTATALIGSDVVRLALEALCAAHRVWNPPIRRILAGLGDQHAEFVALVRECVDAGFPASLAIRVVDRVLELLGGRLDQYDRPANSTLYSR